MVIEYDEMTVLIDMGFNRPGYHGQFRNEEATMYYTGASILSRTTAPSRTNTFALSGRLQ